MKSIKFLIIITIMFLMSSCSSAEIDSDNDYDETDFPGSDEIENPHLIGLTAVSSLNDIQDINLTNKKDHLEFATLSLHSVNAIKQVAFELNDTNVDLSYYFPKNSKEWIVIHILQPEDTQYEILSVTLNNSVYQIGARESESGRTVGVSFDGTKVWIPIITSSDTGISDFEVTGVKYIKGTEILDVEIHSKSLTNIEIIVMNHSPYFQLSTLSRVKYSKSSGVIDIPNIENPDQVEIMGIYLDSYEDSYGLQPINNNKIQLSEGQRPDFVRLRIKYQDEGKIMYSRAIYSEIELSTTSQVIFLDRDIEGDIYFVSNDINIISNTWIPFNGGILYVRGIDYVNNQGEVNYSKDEENKTIVIDNPTQRLVNSDDTHLSFYENSQGYLLFEGLTIEGNFTWHAEDTTLGGVKFIGDSLIKSSYGSFENYYSLKGFKIESEHNFDICCNIKDALKTYTWDGYSILLESEVNE